MTTEYMTTDSKDVEQEAAGGASVVLSCLRDMCARLGERSGLSPSSLVSGAVYEQDARLVGRAVALALSQACYETERAMPEEEADARTGEFGCRRGRRPSVSLEEFILDRLLRYMRAAPEELVTALALVDRALAGSGSGCGVALTWRTAHRLFTAALVVAIKFSQDSCYRNSYYAKVAGVSVEELNALEAALLTRAGFDAWVAPELLDEYACLVGSLATAIAEQERRARERELESAAKKRRMHVPGSPVPSPCSDEDDSDH